MGEEEGPKPWTDDEQRLLEGAIRSVPKTDPSRWDKIAELVPGRTKKECALRVKECKQQVLRAKLEAPEQWTEDEQVVLTKAASKVYPPGFAGDRWSMIAEYVQTHAHTTWRRSTKDVIARVNAMKNVRQELSKKQQGSSDFAKFEQVRGVVAPVCAPARQRNSFGACSVLHPC